MSNPYPRLTYHGDFSDLPAGTLLGFDETYRPYEVIDAEVCTNTHFGTELIPHTHVYLQYATTENIRENGQAFYAAHKMRGTIP